MGLITRLQAWITASTNGVWHQPLLRHRNPLPRVPFERIRPPYIAHHCPRIAMPGPIHDPCEIRSALGSRRDVPRPQRVCPERRGIKPGGRAVPLHDVRTERKASCRIVAAPTQSPLRFNAPLKFGFEPLRRWLNQSRPSKARPATWARHSPPIWRARFDRGSHHDDTAAPYERSSRASHRRHRFALGGRGCGWNGAVAGDRGCRQAQRHPHLGIVIGAAAPPFGLTADGEGLALVSDREG